MAQGNGAVVGHAVPPPNIAFPVGATFDDMQKLTRMHAEIVAAEIALQRERDREEAAAERARDRQAERENVGQRISTAKIESIQGRRSNVAIAMLAVLLSMLTMYVTLRVGALATDALSVALRHSMARGVLAAMLLFQVFSGLRDIWYQHAEIKAINNALPYEVAYLGGKGDAHDAAQSYDPKFWQLSSIGMVNFGFLLATMATFIFDATHSK